MLSIWYMTNDIYNIVIHLYICLILVVYANIYIWLMYIIQWMDECLEYRYRYIDIFID